MPTISFPSQAQFDQLKGRVDTVSTVVGGTTASFPLVSVNVTASEIGLNPPTGANHAYVTVTAGNAQMALGTTTGATSYAAGVGVEVDGDELGLLRIIGSPTATVEVIYTYVTIPAVRVAQVQVNLVIQGLATLGASQKRLMAVSGSGNVQSGIYAVAATHIGGACVFQLSVDTTPVAQLYFGLGLTTARVDPLNQFSLAAGQQLTLSCISLAAGASISDVQVSVAFGVRVV